MAGAVLDSITGQPFVQQGDASTGAALVKIVGAVAGEGGGSVIATSVADGSTVLAAVTPQDVIATAGTPNGRAVMNRGPNDATYVVGATASGAATERTLVAGQEKVFPYMTTLRVSFFSTLGTTIEWETWS